MRKVGYESLQSNSIVVFIVLVVMLATALAGCGQASSQTSHGDSGHAVSGSGHVVTSTASPRMIPAPSAAPIKSPLESDTNVSVTIADGVVYAGTGVAYAGTFNNAVYALRASNGSLLWRTQINGSVDELPVVANGIVYVSSSEGQDEPSHLYALRASDGSVLWRFDDNNYGSYIYSPLVNDNVIYIATQGDGIIALRASDGRQLWRFTAQDGSSYQMSSLVNGILYVSAGNYGQASAVYALRASDGRVLWRYTTDGLADTYAGPDGVVYVLLQDKLAALRAGDGHQLWSRAIDTNIYQSPQIVDGVLYLMTTKIELPTTQSAGLLPQAMDVGALLWSNWLNGSKGQAGGAGETKPLKEGKTSVYAIRASDGTLLWQYAMNNGKSSFASWLQVEQGIVYTSVVDAEGSDTGTISALQSSDGKVLWQDTVDGSPSGALLSNGVIYAGAGTSTSSALYALRAQDGTLVWSYPIDGIVFGDPVLVDTTIYMGAGNGMVYALRANQGTLVWHYVTQTG